MTTLIKVILEKRSPNFPTTHRLHSSFITLHGVQPSRQVHCEFSKPHNKSSTLQKKKHPKNLAGLGVSGRISQTETDHGRLARSSCSCGRTQRRDTIPVKEAFCNKETEKKHTVKKNKKHHSLSHQGIYWLPGTSKLNKLSSLVAPDLLRNVLSSISIYLSVPDKRQRGATSAADCKI